MLYVPLLAGALAAGKGPWRVLLLAAAATFLFIARESLLGWWRARRWGRDAGRAPRLAFLYLGLAFGFVLPLLAVYQLWGLLPVGLLGLALLAVNAEMAARRRERTIAAEVLAIVGLTLTAPAAHYVAGATWSIEAAWLWLLSVLYFASSVFYVRLRVFSAHPRQGRGPHQLRGWCAAYHVSLLASLAALTATGRLSVFVPLAFAPVLARAFWQLFKPAGELNLKRVGWLEVVYSVFFLAFISVSCRL